MRSAAADTDAAKRHVAAMTMGSPGAAVARQLNDRPCSDAGTGVKHWLKGWPAWLAVGVTSGWQQGRFPRIGSFAYC